MDMKEVKKGRQVHAAHMHKHRDTGMESEL